jgi:hypothetical protein
VGRPELFDEDESPIGAFQTPTVRAEPTELQVEDPLTLTIRVVAAGSVQRAPERFRLDDLPGFKEQFFIEYPAGPSFRRLDERTWELVCTLKPRSTNVQAVPSFPFVFFKPGYLPPQRGYQIRRTPSIPLVVRPRTAVQERDVQGGADMALAPESVYQLAEGSTVLRASSAGSLTSLLWIGIIGLVLPPLAATGWYVTWRRLHPDAVHQGQRRRSQAARHALAALRGLDGNGDTVCRATTIVATYLGERFDLTAAEPTPLEASQLLQAAGIAPDLMARTVAFFRSCDAARFAHQRVPEAADFAAAARKLILDLEAESCQAPVSS